MALLSISLTLFAIKGMAAVQQKAGPNKVTKVTAVALQALFAAGAALRFSWPLALPVNAVLLTSECWLRCFSRSFFSPRIVIHHKPAPVLVVPCGAQPPIVVQRQTPMFFAPPPVEINPPRWWTPRAPQYVGSERPGSDRGHAPLGTGAVTPLGAEATAPARASLCRGIRSIS